MTATKAANFIDSIGVNTHLDFSGSSYSNIPTVENAINDLGVKNLRDSANSTADLGANGLWQQVANATGVKFDADLGEGSVADQAQGPVHSLAAVSGGHKWPMSIAESPESLKVNAHLLAAS